MRDEFPTALYELWCRLYSVIDNYQIQAASISSSDLGLLTNRELSEAATNPAICQNLRLSKQPTSSELLQVLVCLRMFENMHRDLNYMRSRNSPTVAQLDGNRYLLVTPTKQNIYRAIKKEERVTPFEDIGRLSTLGLKYDWLPLTLETEIDWSYDTALQDVREVLRIGIAPFANHKEMTWECEEKPSPLDGSVPFFCADAEDQDALWSKIESILEESLSNKVQILLLPELVVTKLLLDRIRAWLYEKNEDQIILLIVAGSRHVREEGGNEGHANRCTVLYGNGEVAWVQDKTQPFYLRQPHLQQMIPNCTYDNAREPALLGKRIAVRNTDIGRIVTPICLDYIARKTLWADLKVDLYLVPAMSPRLDDFRADAWKRGRNPSATMVCNAKIDGDLKHRIHDYIPQINHPTVYKTEKSVHLYMLDIDLKEE
ncbi:MAG: hypothetical protein AB2605_02485 [Candidatus Thiodiazotropha sp.]